MKKYISTTQAPAAVGPYSQAVLSGNTLYLSGQIGLDPQTQQMETTFEEQAKRVFSNIRAVLKEAGYSFSDVTKVTVYLTDMANFAQLNDIYGTFFEPPCPARSCIAVAALPKNALVEIEVVAGK